MEGTAEMMIVGVEEASRALEGTVRGAVNTARRGRLITIRSSLAKKPLTLASVIWRQWKCGVIIDSNWDPVKTQANLPSFNPLLSQELYDYAKLMEAKIENYHEMDYFEHESMSEIRLRSAVSTRFTGFQVVLTTPVVLSDCLRMIGEPVVGKVCMALVALDNTNGYPHVLRAFSEQKDVQDYFLSLPLRESLTDACTTTFITFQHDEIPEIQAESQENVPKFENRPLKIEESKQLTEQLSDKVSGMMDDFGTNLSRTLAGVASNFQAREQSQKVAAELRESLTGFERRLTHFHEEMASEIDRIYTVKMSLQDEVSSLSAELKDTQQTQHELYSALNSLSASFQSTVEKLTSQVDPAEQRYLGWKQELENVKSQKNEREPVFKIDNARQLPTTDLMVDIVSRKPYPVEGEIIICINDAVKYCIPLDISKGKEFLIGSILRYEPGDYSICIKSKKGEMLSNRLPLMVNDSVSLPKPKSGIAQDHTMSMIYRFMGNIEEIELELHEIAGQEGLSTFRRLATQWSNADMQRISGFIDACKETLKDGEDATRERLLRLGFTLAKS